MNNKILKYLLYLSIFLIPFYFIRFSSFDVKTNIFEVVVAVSFALFVIGEVNSLTIRKTYPVSIWIYLFLLAAVIGTLLSPDKIHAIGIFKGWFLFPVILYILVINNFSKENLAKLTIPLYLSLMIVSVWAILQKFGYIGQLFYQVGDSSFNQYLAEGRVFGPFESPNYLAMYLVPMIFLSWPVFKGLKIKIIKSILVLSYALPLLAIYFTTSRGGAVALTTATIAFILFLYFKSKVFRRIIEKQSNILIFGLIIVATIFLIMAARQLSPNQGGDSIRFEIYH